MLTKSLLSFILDFFFFNHVEELVEILVEREGSSWVWMGWDSIEDQWSSHFLLVYHLKKV